MKRPKPTAVWALSLGLALGSGAAGAATLEETIDQTRAFAPGNRLAVANTNGGIEVSTWDREEVRIEARKKVRGHDDESARKAFEELKIVIDESTGGVTIDTDYPSTTATRWWSRKDISMSVHYRIKLPATADLDLETVNGKIDVHGVHGTLELGTTNGAISVREAGGRVSANTTNGGIEVELQQIATGSDMRFKTTNGGITLTLPQEIRANLVARTTNGGIQTDFPLTVQGSLSRNRLEGEINGGGGQIDLRTTNGGIRIREL